MHQPFTLSVRRAGLLSVLAIGAGISSPSASAQTVLSQWTFEINTPSDLTNSATITGIKADAGIFGGVSGVSEASGVHAATATDWTTPAGNGSANSFSANEWSLGDYFQFQTSTFGYEDIVLTWDQTGSNTGPRDFDLFYSLDGTLFNEVPDFAAYLLINGSWSSGTPVTTTSFTADLTALSEFDNQTSVYFRLQTVSTSSINGGTVATGGTGRVDNFTVTAVPEPSTAIMAFLGGVAVFARRRRG